MNPTTNISAVTQSMIDAEKILDKAYNQAVVNDYNDKVANYASNIGQIKALGLPVPPPPVPPMLRITDTNAIIQAEENWSAGVNPPPFFTLLQYVPVPQNPPPTPTALSINEATMEFPGIFEANGDSPSIPVGSSFDQNGHTYKKIVVSYSPFAPNGQVTGWQQIL